MKILVLGNSGSGKTTAAKIISNILGTNPPKNCSDYIIEDYVASKTKSPMEQINLISEIKSNKNDFRKELFTYGVGRQKENPAYPVFKAIKQTDVITGVRTKENLDASKKFFDAVLWIDRDKIKSGSTDQLGPQDADIIVDNNDTIEKLAESLRSIIISELMDK